MSSRRTHLHHLVCGASPEHDESRGVILWIWDGHKFTVLLEMEVQERSLVALGNIDAFTRDCYKVGETLPLDLSLLSFCYFVRKTAAVGSIQQIGAHSWEQKSRCHMRCRRIADSQLHHNVGYARFAHNRP